jgi:hypothetical protein
MNNQQNQWGALASSSVGIFNTMNSPSQPWSTTEQGITAQQSYVQAQQQRDQQRQLINVMQYGAIAIIGLLVVGGIVISAKDKQRHRQR